MIRLDEGACHDMHPDAFHPASQDHDAIAAAQAICAHCPIRLDCLALALANPDALGIWGGLTHEQRVSQRVATRHSRPTSGDLLAITGDTPPCIDEGATAVGSSTVGHTRTADEMSDCVMRHLYASGLTLASIANDTHADAEITARIREATDELDAASRAIRCAVFERMTQDHTAVQ